MRSSKKASNGISTIIVGDSTVHIPSGYDPEEIIGSFVYDRTPAGVPINQIMISLASFLVISGLVYRQLMERGQSDIAKQILPKGVVEDGNIYGRPKES